MPIGISATQDIFKEKMCSLIEEFIFACCYLNDLLILTNRLCNDHLDKVEQVFKGLHAASLEVQAKKCNFTITELKYLQFIISQNGIKPITKKL